MKEKNKMNNHRLVAGIIGCIPIVGVVGFFTLLMSAFSTDAPGQDNSSAVAILFSIYLSLSAVYVFVFGISPEILWSKSHKNWARLLWVISLLVNLWLVLFFKNGFYN
jgi:ABC-type transport system involved in multi-copper enzyme maturation permease subunit